MIVGYAEGSPTRESLLPPALTAFVDALGTLEDTRAPHKVVHAGAEMLRVTLCGVIAGADGWEDREEYDESKSDLRRELLPCAGGIPIDDTLRRCFRARDPAALRAALVACVRHVLPQTADALMAIDGTTSRRSHAGAVQARHLVRALATAARLVLAQRATQEKSHESAAIPA